MCSKTQKARRGRLHHLARLDPARAQRDHLARLHLAQQLGADDVERAALRGDAVVARRASRAPAAAGRPGRGTPTTASFVITTVEKAPSSRGITSATASSIRSASWVERSAAMISESEVPRNWTPRSLQLRVQLDRVDQVAVVGERHLAAVRAPHRLRVLPRRRARRRVAHVADRHLALERAQLLLVEHLRDEPEVAHGHDLARLRWPRSPPTPGRGAEGRRARSRRAWRRRAPARTRRRHRTRREARPGRRGLGSSG